jgi:hypothetical protein
LAPSSSLTCTLDGCSPPAAPSYSLGSSGGRRSSSSCATRSGPNAAGHSTRPGRPSSSGCAARHCHRAAASPGCGPRGSHHLRRCRLCYLRAPHPRGLGTAGHHLTRGSAFPGRPGYFRI